MKYPRAFDVVGDIHGQLGALRALGRELGYAVDDGWAHPDGRAVVFLGDLVDRGPSSLEVAELACELVEKGRAVGVMGNHEYNLVGHFLEREKEKPSNRATIADVAARRERWVPVLERLRDWPLAIELPDLRIVHAVWHLECFGRVAPAIGSARDEGAETLERTADWLAAHIALRSPFDPNGPKKLVDGLPQGPHFEHMEDSAHEILIKGFEEPVDVPFVDNDEKQRTQVRVTWWDAARPEIPRDRTTVFGHYWNLPPVGDAPCFAPPHPSGHPHLRDWQGAHAPKIPPRGRRPVPEAVHHICVDYNGMIEGAHRPCVGALRWPEREVVWAVDEG